VSEKYIKKFKTITSYGSDEFDEEINSHLKNGWEILENSHNVNVSSRGDINVHVKVYKDNSEDYETSTDSNTGYSSTSYSQVLVYKDLPYYNLVFYENGQVKERILDLNLQKNGTKTWWYENGQKSSESNYKDGKEDGSSYSWFDDGDIKSENNYKNGLNHGCYKRWEYGHKVEERNYKNGKLHGLSTIWDGELKIKIENYKNDILEGESYSYHDNGKLRYKIVFKNGCPVGKTECFDEDGNKYHEGNFKDGKIVYLKNYDEKNKLVQHEKYKDGLLYYKKEYSQTNSHNWSEEKVKIDKKNNQFIVDTNIYNSNTNDLWIKERDLMYDIDRLQLKSYYIYDYIKFSLQFKNMYKRDDMYIRLYPRVTLFRKEYYSSGKIKYEYSYDIDKMIHEKKHYYKSGQIEQLEVSKMTPNPNDPHDFDLSETKITHYTKTGNIKR